MLSQTTIHTVNLAPSTEFPCRTGYRIVPNALQRELAQLFKNVRMSH